MAYPGPVPPFSAEHEDDAGDGPQPPEQLDQNPKTQHEKPDPIPGSTSHNVLSWLAEPGPSNTSRVEPVVLGLEKPNPAVLPPRLIIDVIQPENQAEAPRASQQPLTPLAGPAVSPTWWKHVSSVKSKIGSTRPKRASTWEATEMGGSKPPGSQGKAVEPDKANVEAAKPNANLPETPFLVDQSNLPVPVLPSIDIITIHDLGQSLTAAWAYTPEKSFAKRPGAPPKLPLASVLNPAPGPSNATQPIPSRDRGGFEAGLKALGEVKSREERQGRAKGHIHGWAVTHAVDMHHQPVPDPPPNGGKSEPPSEQAALFPAVGLGVVVQDPKPPTTLATDDLPVPSTDKGKGRADGGEKGHQPPAQQRVGAPQPTMGETGEKKPDDDGHISRHSNRPISSKGSKPPSEKDKGLKAGNWLTDPTMLASDLDRARVRAFSYKPLEPTQTTDNSSKKPDYDRYLDETARALLSQLPDRPAAETETDQPPGIPLVFIATGFGCLIVQKLIALAENEQRFDILSRIAAVIFFDAPNPIVTETPKFDKSNKTEKTRISVPILPSPANSARAARVKAILESKAIDGWDLWLKYNGAIKKRRELSTVWFYNSPAQVSNRNVVLPRAAGIDFVSWEPVTAPTNLKPTSTTTNRYTSRFRGPRDPNYCSLVDQIKRCLLLLVSGRKELEQLLVQFIDWGYNLRVRDHQQRCPLHRAAEYRNDAALIRLVSAEPSLAVERDREGLTPLHLVVMNAMIQGFFPFRRAPYRMMIEKLLLALAENELEHADDLKDNSGSSPWDYASEDSYRWIRELREPRVLLNGATVAQPETIEDLITPIDYFEETDCRRFDATLAQLYIAKDDSRDYLDRQGPDVYSVIYDQKDGIEKMFQRNLRPDEDKRATCRWVHLPANNETWVQDLFVRQLRRIDNSTSGRRRHRGSTPFDRQIIPGAFRYKQTHEPGNIETPLASSPGYLSPPPSFSIKSADGPSTVKKAVTALFVPVFGFEKHENRKKLSWAMKNHSHRGPDDTLNLIHHYFDREKLPLHCRRTLDQFTYHMLDDTEARDNSQVMFKWAKKAWAKKEREQREQREQQDLPPSSSRRPDKGSFPVLMIDQLWLWILEDEQIVITSLPNTWEPAEDYNLARYLIRHELRENDDRPLIKDAMDLANSVIRCSIDFLHRPGPMEVTLYDCFQSSITLISESQAQQFNKFKSLVKDLNKDGIDQQTRAKLTNALFQLTTETRLLAEIMDIQDELKTINEVFLKQRDALKKFAQLLSNDHQQKDMADDESDIIIVTPESSNHVPPSYDDIDYFQAPNSPQEEKKKPRQSALYRDVGMPRVKRSVQFADERVPYHRSKSWNEARENLHLVETNIATIKEMTSYAEKVRVEINGLLSHRQKQANAWEARFAREGSEHTQRQSNITLVFTMVTVFFLPLSFMSSVFAIQVDAFPHNTKTGELDWPLTQVMGLIFGISFGMILFLAFLGFYINRISHFFAKHFGRANPPPGGSSETGHQGHDSDTDSDWSDTVAGSRKSGKSRRPSKRMQDGYSEASGSHYNFLHPAPPEYAPFLGVWHFHSKIPWVRKLWEYRFYSLALERVSRPPGPNLGTGGFPEEGAGDRAESASSSSWGDDAFTDNFEWDYPVHRTRVLAGMFIEDKLVRPVARLLPVWMRKKEKVDDEEEVHRYEDGSVYGASGGGDGDIPPPPEEYSIRSSMQRSTVSGTENSWGVPEGPPLRRRRTQQPPRQTSAASIVANLLPWRWGEAVKTPMRRNAPTSSANSEAGGGISAVSLDVTLDLSEDDLAVSGRGSVNGGEGKGRGWGKKGNGLGIALPKFLGRRKVKGEDLESGGRPESGEWAR